VRSPDLVLSVFKHHYFYLTSFFLHWKINPVFIFLIFYVSALSGQNMAMYFTLMEEGKIQLVREKIPELLQKYPGEPAVHYLEAATTFDGDEAQEKFQIFVEKYPNSRYTDDAVMKIGEYFYSRGLYSQASVRLQRFAVDFPESEHVQRGLNLLVRSYQATGELDSARYYVDMALFAVPSIDISAYDLPERKGNASLIKISKNKAKNKFIPKKPINKKPVNVVVDPKNPWVIQVGAFGKYDNARRLVTQLRQVGYKVELDEINSNGRRLHIVRVVRYGSKPGAIKVAQELKKRFGLDYRVINSPEKK